ncbi:MAG: hypothetical protein CSA89_00565 [Bacteroidales bacterium]|nr:MAG: hypothetical protein CSA89_00565 [Bacteroidales bacterium]
MKLLTKFFYRPNLTRVTVDVLVWLLTVVIVLTSRWTTNKAYIIEYFVPFVAILLFFIIGSYWFKRYEGSGKYYFFKEMLSLLLASVLSFCCFFAINKCVPCENISLYTAGYTILLMMLMLFFIGSMYKFYRYATNMDEELPISPERKPTPVLKASRIIDPDELQSIRRNIKNYTDEDSLNFIEKHIDLSSSNSKVVAFGNLFNFKNIRPYRYDALVNITKLNTIRDINIVFNVINERLPDDGLFCLCYESIKQLRDRINMKYPPIVSHIMHFLYFVSKRVLPKVVLTRRLYFNITKGKNRFFSHTEVLGRLYYCGFEVVEELKTQKLNWLIVRRKSTPLPLQHKYYGLIIQLPRVCKNKELRPIYKMRTMFPYAEYIQGYMYQQAGTDDIGKIKDDMRITEWGKVFRKFWIDELPMIYNFIRGDLKLVGVRPVSLANFKTYPQYLQDKRTKVKPGLIPPMYYDRPTTEQGFYDSEEKYIDSYLKSPITTDIRYFFMSIYNIAIKKARSH